MDEYIPSQLEDTVDAPTATAQENRRPPRKRRIVLPVVLFGLTCVSTFYAAGVRVLPGTDEAGDITPIVALDWSAGLTYMIAVMSILLAHELGHFLQAVRYRIPASLPYFIPMPFMPIGTMGAVIGMEGSRANRKQLFDIGITGPLAGLVLAIPIAWYGIKTAVPYYGPQPPLTLMDPLIFQWLTRWLHPDMPANQIFEWNPYYMAGWVGMLITGLNMMPISQLDGGHTAYTLFGKRAHWLGRAVVVAAVEFMVYNGQMPWGMMILLILFIGLKHPPTSDDSVPLGTARTVIGIAALTIPIFCFTPIPISVAMR